MSLTGETSFADTDAALEWAEDRLIVTPPGLVSSAAELAIDDVVIRQGDTDRSLFIARELSFRLRNATRMISELER